jgi:SAM-dependent methyltransferase
MFLWRYDGTRQFFDFGCGSGWWLRVFRSMRYSDLWGYDLDSSAYPVLVAKGISTPSTVDDLPKHHFACIRLEHVLEHVADPVETLRFVRNLLAPKGRIVLVVPNYGAWSRKVAGAQWPGLELPYHVSHFTDRSLRELATQAELRVRHLKQFSSWELALPAIETSRLWKFRGRMLLPSHVAKVGYYLSSRLRNDGEFLECELDVGRANFSTLVE